MQALVCPLSDRDRILTRGADSLEPRLEYAAVYKGSRRQIRRVEILQASYQVERDAQEDVLYPR